MDKKFQEVVIKVLSQIRDIADDINQSGLIKLPQTEINKLKIGMDQVKKSDSKELIEIFIDKREHWHYILGRDTSFFEGTIKQVFPELEISIDVLASPFRALEILSKKKASKKSKNDDPVDVDQIDALWTLLNLLVKAACRYNKEEQVKTKRIDLVEFEKQVGL